MIDVMRQDGANRLKRFSTAERWSPCAAPTDVTCAGCDCPAAASAAVGTASITASAASRSQERSSIGKLQIIPREAFPRALATKDARPGTLVPTLARKQSLAAAAGPMPAAADFSAEDVRVADGPVHLCGSSEVRRLQEMEEVRVIARRGQFATRNR